MIRRLAVGAGLAALCAAGAAAADGLRPFQAGTWNGVALVERGAALRCAVQSPDGGRLALRADGRALLAARPRPGWLPPRAAAFPARVVLRTAEGAFAEAVRAHVAYDGSVEAEVQAERWSLLAPLVAEEGGFAIEADDGEASAALGGAAHALDALRRCLASGGPDAAGALAAPVTEPPPGTTAGHAAAGAWTVARLEAPGGWWRCAAVRPDGPDGSSLSIAALPGLAFEIRLSAPGALAPLRGAVRASAAAGGARADGLLWPIPEADGAVVLSLAGARGADALIGMGDGYVDLIPEGRRGVRVPAPGAAAAVRAVLECAAGTAPPPAGDPAPPVGAADAAGWLAAFGLPEAQVEPGGTAWRSGEATGRPTRTTMGDGSWRLRAAARARALGVGCLGGAETMWRRLGGVGASTAYEASARCAADGGWVAVATVRPEPWSWSEVALVHRGAGAAGMRAALDAAAALRPVR